jgi:hypothetical protein
MARLTEQIGSVNSGKPIIDPGPANPSFLGAVADVAANAIPAVVNFGRERDRRNEQSRQDANAAAIDQAVGGIFNLRREDAAQQALINAPGPEWMGAVDSQTPLPEGVMRQAEEVLRVKRAVSQGRLSPGTLDMRVENFVSSMFQQHPESIFEISTAMKGLGIDHYLFREEAGRRTMEDAESAAQIRGLQTQFQVAAEAGLVTQNMSIEEGAQRGREIIGLRAEAAAAQARYERAVSDNTISNDDRDRETRAAAQTMVSTVISSFGRRVDPYIANFEAAIAAAGTNAEDQAALGEGRIAMMAGISAARRGAIVDLSAVNAPADAVKQVNDFFDAQEAALDRLFDTSFEQNTTAARSLAAGLGIEMGNALPIYGRISAALGQARANALIEDMTSGAPGLSTEIIEAAKAEMLNFDPTSARGTMSLARSIAYLEGKEGLQDFTPDQAPGLVRQNTRALAAVQAAVLGGAESQLPSWEQSFGNTLEATAELSPATATGESVWRAASTFATVDSRRVLAMSIRQNPEFGNALAMASRATAAHVINVATSVPSDSMYRVEYYPETRNYQPYLPREAYDAWAADQTAISSAGRGIAGALAGGMIPGGAGAVPTYEQMRSSANIPEDIRQRVGAANNAIQHLIATDQYDENVRGLSAIERANLYGAGQTPASMANRGTSPTAAGEMRRLRDIATQGAQEFLSTTLATPRTPDIRQGLIQSESGGDPTVVNDEGYGGRMQFGTARLADAAAEGLVPPGTTGAQFAQMSEEQQARVEDWHLNDIDQKAREFGLTRYHGRVIGGVPINENSIRAMAHLGGIRGARRFIESGGEYDPADSNGTKLSDYGRRFGANG